MMINMTMIAIRQNNSSFLRQPMKQGNSSGPMERTAWLFLFASSCPTLVHWFRGSGWYSSTWQIKMISLSSSSYCKPTSSTIKGNFQIFTSDLWEEPYRPPVSLIWPPTIEARTPDNALGKEASGVQACAPGRRVSTEESRLDPSWPPATINAWKCQIISLASLTLVEGRAAQAWWYLFSGSWVSSSTKPLTSYLRQN